MQEEKSKEEQINDAIEDVRLAFLENFRAKQKSEEITRERTRWKNSPNTKQYIKSSTDHERILTIDKIDS